MSSDGRFEVGMTFATDGQAQDRPGPPVWFVRARRVTAWTSAVVEGTAGGPLNTAYLRDLVRAAMPRPAGDVMSDVDQVDAYQVDPGRVYLPHLVVETIVATLRQVAGWIQYPDSTQLLEAAETLEVWAAGLSDPDWSSDLAALSCPMCQECQCDGGCPLEGVRAARPPARS